MSDDIKKLSQEHADWLVELLTPIIKKVAYDSFIHGAKHQAEIDERDKST